MKGIVFTEFLHMVEVKFSPDMVDDIIAAADLPNGGAYTAVGTYPHAELARLVGALSKRSNTPPEDLLKAYGHHVFGRFHHGFGAFFNGVRDSFQFLSSIQGVVHVEVQKLYPDAELPQFDTQQVSPTHLRMTYRSPRCLGDFAEGLLRGCINHFSESISIARRDEMNGHLVFFDLVKDS